MNIQSYDLPAGDYPLTVEYFSVRTGELVHTLHVTGPGVGFVPALTPEHGPVSVKVTFGDGRVATWEPPA